MLTIRLRMRFERGVGESGDPSQDRIGSRGPDERLCVVIVSIEVLMNCLLECGHTSVTSPPDRFLCQVSKPPFDHVEPRGVGRGEVELEARMTLQPASDDRALMGAV